MTEDRDLLYAIFTQHLGFSSPRAVMRLGHEWARRRGQGVTFRQVLREHEVLGEEQARLVDALVLEALRQTGDDAQKAMDSLSPRLKHSLTGFSNTLHPPSNPRAGLDTDGSTGETELTDSLESETRISSEVPGRYSFDTGARGREEELGRGGVGRVLVARDHFLGREIAVKELLREYTGDMATDTLQSSTLEARFLREARLTGQLEHPAVVPVYELGRRTDGTLYYTMQRVRGRTLADALADAGSLEARLAYVPDVLTVCRAIASAHHQGIIHRDLKPQNIMLGAFGATFCMDWGLARVLGRKNVPLRTLEVAPDITAANEVGAVGTPAYMSPEQAMGDLDEVDERSDVWGLGAILFELITGKAPYTGVSPWDVLANVRSEPAPRVLEVEPACPPELAAICQKALQRNRGKRYASAKVMADDLAAWLEDGKVSVYQYGFREVALRLARHNKAAAAATAAVVVALLVVFGVTALRVREERNEARDFARFAIDEVASKLEDTPGSGELLGQLFSGSLELYRQGVDPARAPREEVLRVARAYLRVGTLFWRQGRLDDAARALEQARDQAEHLATRFPDDAEVLATDLRVQVVAVDVQRDLKGDLQAVPRFEALVPLADRLALLAPSNPETLEVAATVPQRLGTALNNAGRFAAALPWFERATTMWERRLALSPRDVGAMEDLALSYSARGLVLASLDRVDEARPLAQRAVTTAELAFAASQSLMARSTRGAVRLDLARLDLQVGHLDDCAREARQVAEDYDARLVADGRDVEALWLGTEARLLADEPAAAWGLAQRLATVPNNEGLVALAAWAAGHDDLAARYAARATESFQTEAHFVQAALAAQAGDRVTAGRALWQVGNEDSDLYLLAPLVVSRRASSLPGPAGELLRHWALAMMERPHAIPELRAIVHGLAGELSPRDGGAP